MKLVLKGKLDEGFVKTIILYIQTNGFILIDNEKLPYYDRFIKDLFHIDYTADKIFELSLLHLDYNIYDNQTEIFVSNVFKLNKQVHLIDVCRMINYGGLKIRGYSIYSELFDNALRNLDLIDLLYQTEEN